MPKARVQWDLYQATLEKRWAAGDAASEIAADIPGATRNAVLGRIHRKGLATLRPASLRRGRRALAPRKPRAPRAPVARPKAGKGGRTITLQPEELTPEARPWEERSRNQCAWPFRRPDGVTLSCCRPLNAGRYCYEHAALAYAGSVSAEDLSRLARVA